MPTRSSLRNQIRLLLNDTNSIRFSDANINTWLDFANSDAITRLGPYDTAKQTGTTVGSNTYSEDNKNYQIAANSIHLKELYLDNENNENRRLEIITQNDMADRYGLSFLDDDSRNIGEPQVAYVVDYNVFGLYPVPDLANNAKTWTAYYYRVPSAFASDSDSPIFLNALHDCLTWYCVARGHYQMGDKEGHAYAFGHYEKMIQKFQLTATTFSGDMRQWRF